MLSLDPEIGISIAKIADEAGTMPVFPRGDWQNRRKMIDLSVATFASSVVTSEQVNTEDFEIEVSDGDKITLRLYKAKDSKPEAALLYTHGGGKFACSLDSHDAICKYYATKADVAVLSVGFRLPPEHPFPASAEDCYAGLCWLSEHANELGIDPARIGVAGDSGGGGFATGVALMARDRGGPALAKQFLIYPMLDDRNTEPDPLIEPFAFWSYDDNYTGWQCYLGEKFGTDDVSSYAAPSREINLAGLPPTFIDVGELDIFRDESIDYASRLTKAGTSVELHVYAGAPHGFEMMAPESALAIYAWQARIRAVRSLYD